jgi:hypothetical protein
MEGLIFIGIAIGEYHMSQIKKLENGYYVYSPFRSLKNYKEMHRKTADQKGVSKEFQAAATLTAARRILFGVK